MRFGRTVTSLAVCGLAAQIFCTLPAAALENPGTGVVERNRPAQTAAVSQETFVIGDRLKITFFEKYATIADQEEQPTLSALVERPEMTGEYVVQQDGHIFLPLIGTMMTAGKTSQGLQDALSERFDTLFDGQVAVAIQLLEREPIYVTGAIAQAGTYQYVPGMTVLHALALSGSVGKAGADQWQKLEFVRERERSRQSQNKLERLLARASVLMSEIGLQSETPLQRLRELAGQEAADRLLADASELRDLEREKIRVEHAAAQSILDSLDKELAILHESIANAETNMREKAERAAFMQILRKRGDTIDQNVHLARSELSQARTTWNELRASQTRIERNITEVRHQTTRLEMEDRIQLERDLQTTREAIADEEATRATVAQLLVNVQSFGMTSDETRDPSIEMEIIRRTPSGVERLPSSAFTEMRPGDVLYIRKEQGEHETVGM